MDIYKIKGAENLVKAFLALDNEEECKNFIEDLLTTKEIIALSQRLMVAEMLADKKNYTVIAEETGASSATISRVNRCYVYGEGGYKNVLEKIKKD